MNLKNMDKKTKLYIGIVIGTIIFLILILLILKILVGGRVNSKVFETRLKDAAVDYYKKYPEKLPKSSGNVVTITIDELVKSKTLKDPSKLLNKNITCEGKVNISNNNGFYLYQPVISCSDDYKTDLLYKRILNDNQIVTSGNGLYKINDYYIYRGENLNNYVKFANMNWQIVRINNDNTIKLILVDNIDTVVWDNRYNIDKNENIGKNDFNISRIKDTLNEYFTNKTFNDDEKSLIVPKTLCIGARNEKTTIIDGSVECSKKLENQPIGLLQVNEYMLASLEPTCKYIEDNQCANYNYLSKYNNFWTLTANSKNSYEVYRIYGSVESSFTSNYAQPKLVINISSDTLYKLGNGTKENPYIIK